MINHCDGTVTDGEIEVLQWLRRARYGFWEIEEGLKALQGFRDNPFPYDAERKRRFVALMDEAQQLVLDSGIDRVKVLAARRAAKGAP